MRWLPRNGLVRASVSTKLMAHSGVLCGLTRPIHRFRRGRSRSLFVPPEHTHGPEGIPPARSAVALVHREMHAAGMGVFLGPAAPRGTLGLHHVAQLRNTPRTAPTTSTIVLVRPGTPEVPI